MKRYFALVFVLLAACSGVFAQQADRVLVDGDPPLRQSTVNELIDFFEFGLAAKFNVQERSKFEAQRIADWQNPDTKNKQALLGILETRTKLMQMDDAKLRETQATVQQHLLDNFAKQPNDPTAQLLMEVYNNGHSALSAVSSATVGQPNLGGGDVSVLLGTWGTGTVSSVNYVNNLGSSTNGGGTQVQYTFKPGNQYEFAALTTSTLYSCSMKFLTYKSGIVQFNGNSLTFIPQHATFTSQDSCSAKDNYQKPAEMNRETFNWSIQQDQYGTKLCLQNATINGCAYKR
jgi:hypothetical protein